MRLSIAMLCALFVTASAAGQQTYLGSNACKTCHGSVHDHWKQSGHPYKIQKLVGGAGPAYPVLSAQKKVGNQVNYVLQSGIPNPPSGLAWSDIGFVLGGYHSNARFLDTLGYFIYGNNRQYNLPTNRWVAYTSGTLQKGPYNYSCYKCHTTGASKTKTPAFEAYPGIEGSWAEAGVGCEGCHGAGSAHAGDPINIKPPKEGKATCSSCHARDRSDSTTTYAWSERVEWQPRTVSGVSTGFIRHREQGDMMLASKHKNMSCTTCHDPHKGMYFELGGLKASVSCGTCHPGKEIVGHEAARTSAECTDCHMPFAARNGDQITPYVSEQSTHFWKILTDTLTMFQNLEDISTFKFIKRDSAGYSGLTLDYTCLQCHTDKTVQWASGFARSMHGGITSVAGRADLPTAYSLAQNYPNPFNPSTTIRFSIPRSSFVSLQVFAITGQVVATLVSEAMVGGWHEVRFEASHLPSGVYFYRLQAGDFAYSRKMVMVK